MTPHPDVHPVAHAYAIDVSRPIVAWRWTAVFLVPLQLLALAWAIPLALVLIMLVLGLVAALGAGAGRAVWTRV